MPSSLITFIQGHRNAKKKRKKNHYPAFQTKSVIDLGGLRLVDTTNLIFILSRLFIIQGSEPYLCDFALKKKPTMACIQTFQD